MSQHDYVIDNASAASVRADINNALGAIVSTNSGATAPSTTYANMLWYDTANDLLKMRDEADSAWITLGTLDQSAKTFEAALGITFAQGDLIYHDGSTLVKLAKGTAFQTLAINSGATAPSWIAAPGASGTVLTSTGTGTAPTYQAITSGWSQIGTNEPTSDVAAITFTGVSGNGYRSLRMSGLLQTAAGGTGTVEIRASSGTWRTIASFTHGNDHAFKFGCVIDNLDGGAASNIIISDYTFTNFSVPLDRSDNAITVSGSNGSGYSSYSDTIDEVRFTTTSTIRGATADTRGFVTLEAI